MSQEERMCEAHSKYVSVASSLLGLLSQDLNLSLSFSNNTSAVVRYTPSIAMLHGKYTINYNKLRSFRRTRSPVSVRTKQVLPLRLRTAQCPPIVSKPGATQRGFAFPVLERETNTPPGL